MRECARTDGRIVDLEFEYLQDSAASAANGNAPIGDIECRRDDGRRRGVDHAGAQKPSRMTVDQRARTRVRRRDGVELDRKSVV